MPPFAFSPTAPTCLISCHLCTQSLSHRSRLPTFRRVQGRIGFMRFPGSEVVLDRPSKKLVLCDRDRCPYADRCVGMTGHLMRRCMHARQTRHALSRRVCKVYALCTLACVIHRSCSVTNPEGTTMLINRSPYFDASTYSINAKLPPDLTFFTYNVLSYLCSEAVSTRLALHPDGGRLVPATCLQSCNSIQQQPFIGKAFMPRSRHAPLGNL